MQKKFIGITMKHLIISKYAVFIFMIFIFISCGHTVYLVYNKDQNLENSNKHVYSKTQSSSSKRIYEETYCTSEDKEKGLKTKVTIDALKIPCGRSQIQPKEDRTLEIKRIVSGVEEIAGEGDLLLGHHLLVLKSGDEILQEMKVEKEDDPFWKEVVFVKIREGVYWQDLDGDGYLEFAILSTEMGIAIYRPAYIYTLKDNLFHFYGEGRYIWYKGQHVLLNCPECWEDDLDKCDQCT